MQEFLNGKQVELELAEENGELWRTKFRERIEEFDREERLEVVESIHQSQSAVWRQLALLRNRRSDISDRMQSVAAGTHDEAYAAAMAALTPYSHDFTRRSRPRDRRLEKRLHVDFSEDAMDFYGSGFRGERNGDEYWCPITRGYHGGCIEAAPIIPQKVSGKVVLGALRRGNVIEDGTEIVWSPSNAIMMYEDVAKAFADGRFVIVPLTAEDEVRLNEGETRRQQEWREEQGLREQELASLGDEIARTEDIHARNLLDIKVDRLRTALDTAAAKWVDPTATTPSRGARYKAVVLDQTLLHSPSPRRRVECLNAMTDSDRTTWADIHNSELIFRGENRPAPRNLFFHFVVSMIRRGFFGPEWDRDVLKALQGVWPSEPYFRLSMLQQLVRLAGTAREESLLKQHALDWENVCFDEQITLPDIDDANLAAKELASSLLAQMPMPKTPYVVDDEDDWENSSNDDESD